MAKLTVSGKRKEIESDLIKSARSSGTLHYSTFTVGVSQRVDKPSRTYEFHRIEFNRTEAEQLYTWLGEVLRK